MNSILNPDYWPFGLSDLPDSIHLVGGGVRDALLGHSANYLDLDFVVDKNPVDIAKGIAQRYQAGYVLLDASRQIARVVFEEATADFALQVGNSLEDDLHRRDFAINAIAYSPHDKQVIDPLDGYKDLKQGVIRMIHPENLKDDPLRLLRAYRQASQLNFKLDEETRQAIRHYSPLLKQVAAERVRVELGYLLSSAQGTNWLEQLFTDGLLDHFFPALSDRGVSLIGSIDQAAIALRKAYPELAAGLTQPLSDRAQGPEAHRRTILSTSKLLGLLSSDVEQTEETLMALKYSRNEIRLVGTLLQAQSSLYENFEETLASNTLQYHLFKQVGQYFPALVLVALAKGYSLEMQRELIQTYLDESSPVSHPKAVLSGRELIQALNLTPGPQIGQLLSMIAVAQAEGLVQSAEDAIAFVKEHLDS
ncbi:MAG: CCA tRNA nucleotidyltransferase [Acaryochloridaceae cyanobacterium RL_2_7]|nr:CCA tRNA nucleotidyltransferase [Acaryochloridaceae cyanobacterium RL_2_7]